MIYNEQKFIADAKKLGASDEDINRRLLVSRAEKEQATAPVVAKQGIITRNLPTIGGVVGGVAGSLLGPAGAVAGGAAGSALGEYGRQKIGGENDTAKIVREGALGLAGGVGGEILGAAGRGVLKFASGKVAKAGAGNLMQKALARGAEMATGTEAGTVTRAFERPAQVGAAMRGETDIVPILKETRAAIKSLSSKTTSSYGKEFDRLAREAAEGSGDRIDLREIRDGLLGTINRYGGKAKLNVTSKGKKLFANVDFSLSSISDPRETASLNQLFTDINTWDDYSIKGINNLKQRLQNAYRETASKKYNAIVTDLSNDIGGLLEAKVPGLGQLNADYGAKQELIKALEQKVGGLSGEGQLSNLFGKNKAETRELFAELEKLSGTEITELIKDIKAGQELSGAFPTTGSRTLDVLRSLFIGFGTGGPAGALAGAAATSPRVVGEIATRAGEAAAGRTLPTLPALPGAIKMAGNVAAKTMQQGGVRLLDQGTATPLPTTPSEVPLTGVTDTGVSEAENTAKLIRQMADADIRKTGGKNLGKLKQYADLVASDMKAKKKTEKQMQFESAAQGAGHALELLNSNQATSGPIAGRLAKLGGKVGSISNTQQDYFSTVALARSALLNAYLGGNIPPAEYARISDGIPIETDTVNVAKQKLKTFIREMSRFSSAEVSQPGLPVVNATGVGP